MDNYTKTLMYRMAELTQTEITVEHLRILEFAAEYYSSNHVGPLYQNIKRETHCTKADIERLFPHGLTSVYSWVGIPIHTTREVCKPVAMVHPEAPREVYLDHNATTYIRDEVRKVMLRALQEEGTFGNPSSSTDLGRQAYGILQTARTRVADTLKVHPKEVHFVGGGSEANNMAIKGIAFQHLKKPGHIITSKIEHSSVLKTVQYLESIGFQATYLDPTPEGIITPESVQQHLRDETLLVSIMAVNNEIGSINPIGAIGEICQAAKIPFMVDAVQGFGKIPICPKELGISLLSISGHKIYAPKGVGALYKDPSIDLVPLIHGGGQEFSQRAGTENLISILAFGRAAQLAHKQIASQSQKFTELSEYFLSALRSIEPKFVLNGSATQKVPSCLNIGFPKIDSGALLLSLNQIGVYVSAGSACSAGSKESSHVLKAIGADTEQYGSIRFSFGLKTSQEDIDYLLKYLPPILKNLRT